jgi:hypothetical protein
MCPSREILANGAKKAAVRNPQFQKGNLKTAVSSLTQCLQAFWAVRAAVAATAADMMNNSCTKSFSF